MGTLQVVPQEFIPYGHVKYELIGTTCHYVVRVAVGKTIKVFGRTISKPTEYAFDGVVNLRHGLDLRNYKVGLKTQSFGEVEIDTLGEQGNSRTLRISHKDKPVIGTAVVTSSDGAQIDRIVSAEGRVPFGGLSLVIKLREV